MFHDVMNDLVYLRQVDPNVLNIVGRRRILDLVPDIVVDNSRESDEDGDMDGFLCVEPIFDKAPEIFVASPRFSLDQFRGFFSRSSTTFSFRAADQPLASVGGWQEERA